MQPKPMMTKNLRIVFALITLFIFAALLSSFSCKQQNEERGAAEILVGGYGALTGSTATFGQSGKKGYVLALEEINGKGGVLGKKLRLVMEDDQGKPEEAQTVVTKLITSDRVVAVLGEAASSRTLAAAPVCQQNGIPLITPSSTNPRVTQVGDYIFRVCFIDPFQGYVMAKFARQSLKINDVAILRDIKNDYSVGLAAEFTQHFQKLGGRIVGDESYSEGDTDFSAQLTGLRSRNPEGIFIPGYYTEVGLIARQARKLNLKVPLFGSDGWDSPKLGEIGGDAINGSYFSSHFALDAPQEIMRTFVKNYGERYNELPDGVAALAYDAMKLLSDAFLRAQSSDPKKVRDALATTRNFEGVTGRITIDANRNASKPAIILQVKDGKAVYVESIEP